MYWVMPSIGQFGLAFCRLDVTGWEQLLIMQTTACLPGTSEAPLFAKTQPVCHKQPFAAFKDSVYAYCLLPTLCSSMLDLALYCCQIALCQARGIIFYWLTILCEAYNHHSSSWCLLWTDLWHAVNESVQQDNTDACSSHVCTSHILLDCRVMYICAASCLLLVLNVYCTLCLSIDIAMTVPVSSF